MVRIHPLSMKHEFARKLRRDQTDVERKLWFALRSRQFGGFKFRRQQAIAHYIVDFVCFEASLILELDGGQHGSDYGVAYDLKRTQFLGKNGFKVVRFPNHEINSEFDNVLNAITHHLRNPLSLPLSERENNRWDWREDSD